MKKKFYVKHAYGTEVVKATSFKEATIIAMYNNVANNRINVIESITDEEGNIAKNFTQPFFRLVKKNPAKTVSGLDLLRTAFVNQTIQLWFVNYRNIHYYFLSQQEALSNSNKNATAIEAKIIDIERVSQESSNFFLVMDRRHDDGSHVKVLFKPQDTLEIIENPIL